MKKIILLLSVISIISCKKEVLDYAVISGKILNTTSKKLSISSEDRKINDAFVINTDGTFNDTIKGNFGIYSFYDGKNYKSFHASAGDNIQINYDAKDFDKTLTYSGLGSDISVYLLTKSKKSKELLGGRGEIYKLSEADFKTKMNEIKTTLGDLLSSFKNISSEFSSVESKNLQYEYLTNYQSYERNHAYYTKNKGFKASEDFLSELNKLDYNNEKDYGFSPYYKMLVERHYRNLGSDLAEKDSLQNDIAYLKTLNSVPSQTIKNDLLFNEAIFGIKYTKEIEEYFTLYSKYSTNEANNERIKKIYENIRTLSKGRPSPKFVNYENYDGSKTSLDDLKGKYVYIDVWATWCGPCKAEIPSLQRVEKEYHGKNIHFVSISVDKQKDHAKWKKMVKDMNLTGIQLIADNDFNSDFIRNGYMINAIPQFILLDPEGNIVTKSAPRPSNEKLIDLFNELKI